MALKFPFLGIGLLVGCFLVILRITKNKAVEKNSTFPLIGLSLAYLLFFLLQAILAHPDTQYQSPSLVFTIVNCGLFAEFFSKMLLSKIFIAKPIAV